MLKRTVLCILLVVSVCFLTSSSSAQDNSLIFSVKTGLNLQAGQLGLAMGSLQPCIGLDYLFLSLEADIPSTEMTEETSGLEVGAGMFLPYAGAKFFLSTGGGTEPYIFGNFYKAFPSISVESGGENLLGDELEDFIKELLGFWGIKAGFGAQYKVSDHFSIGGEYGLNMFFLSGKLSESSEEPNGAVEDAVETEIKASMRHSFVAVVLNFTL